MLIVGSVETTPDCGDDFKVLFDDKVIEVCWLLPTSTC